MQVASLELCRELHALSGWGDTYLCHYLGSVRQWMPAFDHHNGAIPTYDLGYLLRRLPASIDRANLILCTDGIGMLEEINWCVYYDAEPVQFKAYYHDTPEDAACSLAIQLFKRGVLVRKEDV